MSRKNMYIAVAVGLVVVVLFLVLGFFNIGRQQAAPQPTEAQSNAQTLLNEIAKTGSVSSLQVVTTAEGTGEGAKAGDTITVQYTGVLPDGTMFDTSRQEGRTPFSFVLGSGQVIQGWEQGLVGMKVGERRLVAIPPQLGYGERSMGKIPPNATLIFDVELLSINGAK